MGLHARVGSMVVLGFALVQAGCHGDLGQPLAYAGARRIHLLNDSAAVGDWVAVETSRATGPCSTCSTCSNGSTHDCNVAGTTLRPHSAYVDPSPPAGWTQCAGFVNTSADDVLSTFLDHCLDTTALRIRVATSDHELEEDVMVTGMTPVLAWPNFDYLYGETTVGVSTRWASTTFFTTTDGRDACMQATAPNGTTFGGGSADAAVVAGGNEGFDEYRLGCGKAALPNRTIALYRRDVAEPVIASPTCPAPKAPFDVSRLPAAWTRCASKAECTMVRGGGCCWPMVVNRTHAAHVQASLDEMACGVCTVTECAKDEPFECRNETCMMIPTNR